MLPQFGEGTPAKRGTRRTLFAIVGFVAVVAAIAALYAILS